MKNVFKLKKIRKYYNFHSKPTKQIFSALGSKGIYTTIPGQETLHGPFVSLSLQVEWRKSL